MRKPSSVFDPVGKRTEGQQFDYSDLLNRSGEREMRTEDEIEAEIESLVAKAREVHAAHHRALLAFGTAIGERRYRGPEAEALSRLKAQLDQIDHSLVVPAGQVVSTRVS